MKKTKKRFMSAILLVIMIFMGSTTAFAGEWELGNEYILVYDNQDPVFDLEDNEGFVSIGAFSETNRPGSGNGSQPQPPPQPPSGIMTCPNFWCCFFCFWSGGCFCVNP